MVKIPSRIVVIAGPTATGKTQLALDLAKKHNGELISADSRQIYKDFDIGTGKEVEELRKGIAEKVDEGWVVGGVPIHCYDLVDGHTLFSAGLFAIKAREKIANIQARDKLPILVGGTGLYIKATIEGIDTVSDVDQDFRQELSQMTVENLQSLLKKLDPNKLALLNSSDRQNPRRLIRRIEIASSEIDPGHEDLGPLSADISAICLYSSENNYEKNVTFRVQKMIQLGLSGEIQEQLAHEFSFSDPAFQAIGYREFKSYVNDDTTIGQVEQQIILHTMQYIKRQITWFKAQKDLTWYSIDDSSYPDKIEKVLFPTD